MLRCCAGIKDTNTSEVLYIDYGNSECLPLSELRVLPHQFAVLPAQAVPCCLDGVLCRPDTSGSWSTQEVDEFSGLADDEVQMEVKSYRDFKHYVELSKDGR